MIAEAVVQVPRVDVQCVDKECSSSHGGDRWNCGIDHKSAINGALLINLCTTNSFRSRNGMPSTDHPDSSENSGGSTSVVL